MVRATPVNVEHSRILPIDCNALPFAQGLPMRSACLAGGFNFFSPVDKAIPGRSIAQCAAPFLTCLVVKLGCFAEQRVELVGIGADSIRTA